MLQTNTRGGRKLTAAEITFLSGIFATGLTFDLIRVHKGYHPDLTEEEKKEIEGRSHVTGNDIYLVGDDWSEDLTKDGNIDKLGTFVHEMAHIWQNQNDVGLGGIQRMDNYHSAQMDIYEAAVDSLETIIESGIKHFQRRYKKISEDAAIDSVKAAIPETIAEYRKSSDLAEFHTDRYKADKWSYRERDSWDPVFQPGPQPQYARPWTLPTDGNVIVGLSLDHTPKPGERLSDFVWRSPLIQRRYKTKANLIDKMQMAALDDSNEHAHSRTDYNYMLKAPGKAHFLMLRREAQAKLVEDYFYLTRGVDPRTRPSSNHDYRPRPTLAFYKMMIPFLPGKQAVCD
ncbi:hypothetical protein AADZ90_008545 [Aestuariibius sp. 2305UL40-4]|uniref:hypothetical protein n=1 Tax=Aestuariibius violaceus TaxID=3234132 RepID=UPI00345EE233